jgi:hypothetical protein
MCRDYIENWFQEVIMPQCHFVLQCFLLPNQIGRVSDIQAIIEVTFLYVDMGKFLVLLRTWLHWKSSYT